MSVAKILICSSSVLSRTISAISTAWAWWTDMSRANPASADESPGGLLERNNAREAAARKTATPARSR
jgi:hypothetical protein